MLIIQWRRKECVRSTRRDVSTIRNHRQVRKQNIIFRLLPDGKAFCLTSWPPTKQSSSHFFSLKVCNSNEKFRASPQEQNSLKHIGPRLSLLAKGASSICMSQAKDIIWASWQHCFISPGNEYFQHDAVLIMMKTVCCTHLSWLIAYLLRLSALCGGFKGANVCHDCWKWIAVFTFPQLFKCNIIKSNPADSLLIT